MKRRTLFVVLCIIVTACLAWMFLTPRTPAPAYQGRPLSSWLAQLDDGDRDHETGLALSPWSNRHLSESQVAAAEAIRELGTNTLPFLVAETTRDDSRTLIRLKNFLRSNTRFSIAGISNRIEKQKILRHQAALGLATLGPVAKPALPELVKSFHSGYHTKQVTIAIAGVGPEGWAELTKAITNSNDTLALHGIWGMGMHGAAVPGTVDALLLTLTNATGLTDISVWALGEIKQNPERVVPALITALQSSNTDIRRHSAGSLAKFGPQATNSIAALRQALEDSNPGVRKSAAQALKAINVPKSQN